MTIEEDWERNLVASCSNAEDDCLASSDEDGNNQDDASAPTILSSRVAVNYLQELKEFALLHKNEELLDYFTQSQLIVEQTFSQNNTTQTKLFYLTLHLLLMNRTLKLFSILLFF